jgi:hypothetical protein
MGLLVWESDLQSAEGATAGRSGVMYLIQTVTGTDTESSKVYAYLPRVVRGTNVV